MAKNILKLTNEEAKEFFLTEERYFTFDLPQYFTFNKLIKKLSKKLEGKNLTDFYSQDKDGKKNDPKNFEDVNYKLFSNKNGEYSWRLFQLIHPAIYVSLVHNITEEKNWDEIVKKLNENTKIECVSIPVVKSKNQKSEKGEQILTWWKEVEQKSISMSLEYSYIFLTDIVDCYGSIYTHSISWALHTKKVSKTKRGRNELLGNFIDNDLRSMSYGQTNGIPQGSILMDLIAEIVLKYADIELSSKLENLEDKDFKIIRYRDDYRIFVNNPEIGKQIVKELSLVLAELGMKINSEKTVFSNDIINSSIKEDKLFWLTYNSQNSDIEKHLLIIKNLSDKYKNSGILVKELQDFYQKIYKQTNFRNIKVLISIITDIAFNNPRTYPISASILGKFISTLKKEDKKDTIEKIEKKFKKLPNTEILDLWLQRLTLKFDPKKEYQSKLAKKVIDDSQEIWNSKWLNKDIRKVIKETTIVDNEKIEKMDEYPNIDEVSMFFSKTNYFN